MAPFNFPIRSWTILSALGLSVGMLFTACNRPPPVLDTTALPTTTTSAEPLFSETPMTPTSQEKTSQSVPDK